MIDLPEGRVLIDPRIGSREMYDDLARLRVPCEISREPLEAADFAWMGKGRHGLVPVGVERKRLRDALNCMTGGRFAGHQLPLMLERYPYAYLIVEGIWRTNPSDGVLEEAVHGGWRAVGVGSRRHMGRDLNNWLCSLSTLTKLRVRQSDTPQQTAFLLRDMYLWWQKDWDEHSSLNVIYGPDPPAALVVRPNLTRRVAAQFRMIGWERSAAVAAYFGSPLAMALALRSDWRRIPGIGKVIADSVVRQWETGEER